MSSTASNGKERRQQARLGYLQAVRISWTSPRGEPQYTQAKCLELSESGLRLETREQIPSGSYVTFFASPKLSGTGVVRHVSHVGTKYILGLAFNQPIAKPIFDLLANRNFQSNQ